jgi:hypothetical protein
VEAGRDRLVVGCGRGADRLCADGRCIRAWPDGRGALDTTVDEVVVEAVDAACGGAGAGAGGGRHDSDTLTTASLTGRPNADTGVPGGTETVTVFPPSSVTVSVHVSAEAAGMSSATGPRSAAATGSATVIHRGDRGHFCALDMAIRYLSCASCSRQTGRRPMFDQKSGRAG